METARRLHTWGVVIECNDKIVLKTTAELRREKGQCFHCGKLQASITLVAPNTATFF